jgi:hypothetical protein
MIILTKAKSTVIVAGGISQQIADTTMGAKGGIVINPPTADDQGIAIAESLWVNILGSATIGATNGTVELLPGQSFLVPPLCNVWVIATTTGHQYTSYFSSAYTVPFPPTIVPGQPGSGTGASIGGFVSGQPFPPDGPTGLLLVIPSYLYQEYSDDDDLQGFVAAQNQCQQDYVDTFNGLNLPIYTGPVVSNALLDWVGTGLYGMSRPALSSGLPNQIGPLNTWGPNWLIPLNGLDQITPGDIVITNDDLYRRILTWHFYKADGNYFSTRWLKRRVWRFLYGQDGKSPEVVGNASIADTEQISITIGVNRNITIRFVLGHRTVRGGAILNQLGVNGFSPGFGVGSPFYNGDIQLNDIESTYVPFLPLPYMTTFQEALHSGVLELPYQYNYTNVIG